MKLIDDWKRVLRLAWSARLALLSALLSAAEVGVQLMAPQWGGVGAALAALTALAATIARIVQQAALRQADEQAAGPAAAPTEPMAEVPR